MLLQSFDQHVSRGKYEIAQDYSYIGDDFWNWSVWIEASETSLDKIENVIYNLHYTFKEPVRIINTRNNKFKLETSGWGTFTIYARINFKDKSVLELEHELELYYPEGDACEK